MSKVLDESRTDVDTKRKTKLEEMPPLETIERPAEFRPAPRVPEPSKFIRWMGWLLGALLVAGIGGLGWWAVSQIGDDVSAPSAIDPHESPEILRSRVPSVVSGAIDPHESPEILRSRVLSVVSGEIDPHESPEVLRTLPVTGLVDPLSMESLELLRSLPTEGIDELSLESMQLLRSLPAMAPVVIDPHVSPEVLRAIPVAGVDSLSLESLELLRSLPATAPVEIDPHVSPEVLRSFPPVESWDYVDPHESPEILRVRTP